MKEWTNSVTDFIRCIFGLGALNVMSCFLYTGKSDAVDKPNILVDQGSTLPVNQGSALPVDQGSSLPVNQGSSLSVNQGSALPIPPSEKETILARIQNFLFRYFNFSILFKKQKEQWMHCKGHSLNLTSKRNYIYELYICRDIVVEMYTLIEWASRRNHVFWTTQEIIHTLQYIQWNSIAVPSG